MDDDRAIEIIGQVLRRYVGADADVRGIAYQIIAALRDEVHAENMPDLSSPAPDAEGNPRFGCG